MLRGMYRAALLVPLLVGCTSSAPPAPPVVAPVTPIVAPEPVSAPVTPPPAPPPAQHGIQVGDLDRTIDPCTDFFEYSNGTWRAQNPIPPSMPRWSRRWAAGEANKDQL